MSLTSPEAIASEYKGNKKAIANAARMGLIDAAAALMAGMHIDRMRSAVAEEQKADTTVVQDIFGAPMQQQGLPQAPMRPQPQQPRPQMAQSQGIPGAQMAAAQPQMAPGVEGLPTGNVGNYAEGGIVAFGDGGDVPRYKEEGLVNSPYQRAVDRFLDPIANRMGEMNEREQLQNRIRANFDPYSGVGGFFKPQTEEHRAFVQQVIPNLNSMSTDELRRLAQTQPQPGAKNLNATNTAPPPAAATTVAQTDTTPPPPRPAPPRREAGSRNQRNSGPRESTGPAATRKSAILDQPELPTEKPFITRPTIPDAPVLGAFDPNKIKISGEDLPTYTQRDRKEIRAERRAAELEEGVDPEMYAKMIKGVEDKKGKLAKRRGEAGGEAFMNFGLGLMGARKGEEFQTISKSGKEALGVYKQDVKDLRAAEEKYDERIEALRMSDQQAKLTGARADQAQVEQDRQLAFNANVERIKAKNDLSKSSALIGAQLYTAEAQHGLGVYQAKSRTATDIYQAEQTAASKHFSDLLGAKVQLHTALQQARTAEEGHRIQLQIANINAETQKWIHSRPPAEIQAIDIYAKRTGKPFEQAAKDFYQARAGGRTMYTREEMMKDARKNLENRGILNPTEAQMQTEIDTIRRTYEGGGGGGGGGSLQQGPNGEINYVPRQ
jgi:hypothetical protein